MKILNNKGGYFVIIGCLIGVLFINDALADWQDDGSCEQNTNCTISIFVVNETNGYPVSSAQCNITIWSPNNTQVINTSTGSNIFSNYSDGIYNYTINYGITGYYPAKATCVCDNLCPIILNGTDVGDVDFVIGSPVNYNNYLYTFLSLLPLGLFWFARRYNYAILIMLSGIMLATFGVVLYANRFPLLLWETNLITQTFSLMILAIGLYIIGRTSIELTTEAWR